MAKKNKKNQVTYRIGDGSVVAIETEHYRKGKIRAKSKKEKQILIGACTHHVIGKNGKLKPKFYNDGRGKCVCNMCGYSFPTKMKQSDAVAKAIEPAKELNNQAKMVAQAMNADKSTIRFFSEFGSMIQMYPKYYNNIKKVAEKSDNMRNKKKKGKGNGGGNTTFGAWK